MCFCGSINYTLNSEPQNIHIFNSLILINPMTKF